jgi:carotenoid cleavage dioxygenase-like enzyme
MSKIPLMNIVGSLQNFDNNWVMPYRMPDNKTYVSLTDTPNMLKINPQTLEPLGLIKWDDDIMSTTGTTHVKTLPNGDLVGVCAEITMKGENLLTAYRITAENINKRIRIGSVSTGSCSVYQHAFGLSENYITIFQHPISTDMAMQAQGKDMISCYNMDGDDTTKVHAIRLSDGETTTFDTGIFF